MNFTVLHLCSAHVLKAVTHGFSKQTGDHAVKEYATYCFGLILNSTTLQEALNLFQDMSILFMSANHSDEVEAAKNTLDEKILKSKPTTVDDCGLTTYVEDMTICGRSPFTRLFKSCLETRCAPTKSLKKNEFYCTGIIDVLLNNYMGIFPLWSGILLGELSRFFKEGRKDRKTRETNCHVEQWFSIVKNHSAQKEIPSTCRFHYKDVSISSRQVHTASDDAQFKYTVSKWISKTRDHLPAGRAMG